MFGIGDHPASTPRRPGPPTQSDLLIITAAINSVDDTITREEAEEVILTHGGQPAWIDDPPPFAQKINRHYQDTQDTNKNAL